MGIKQKINQTLASKVSSAHEDLVKTMKEFEDHLIQVQKNQVEFEQYLQRIEKKLEDENSRDDQERD